MTNLSPLAAEIRRIYHRQYRQRKQSEQTPRPAVHAKAERDRRYWEKKAQDLLDQLEQSGHADMAEKLRKCPSAADFVEYQLIIEDFYKLKT